MIKIELIITDETGNRIVVNKSYEDNLTGKTLDEIESLVFKAKSDSASDTEEEILKLNSTAYSKKKSECYLNGTDKVMVRTLNGVYPIANQRYKCKKTGVSTSFLALHSPLLGQERGFASKGLMEFLAYYSNQLSFRLFGKLKN